MSNSMPLDYDDIIGRLRGLLVMLDCFTSEERGEVEHFIDVGEFGLALETLAHIIVEEEKEIPRWTYDAMCQLAEKMEMGDQMLTELADHVAEDR